MKMRNVVFILLTIILVITLVSGCHKPTDPNDPVDLKLTKETVVIDPDQTTINQVTPNQVIVTGSSKYRTGDVIVSEVSTAAPSGFLRKVQSVSVQGNRTVLNTVPATLEDVFLNADILVNQALSTKDIKESRVLTNGVFFEPDVKNDEKFSYSINKPIILPTGQTLNITGTLGVENSFKFDLKIRNKNISFLKYTHISEQSSQLAVSVSNSYNFSRDYDLYEHTFIPVTVWVGPVPLVFVPKIKVVLNVSVRGESGVSASITQRATLSAGVQLQNGQWTTFNDKNISFNYQPPQLTNGLSVSVGAGPDLSLMLYGVAGPYANTRGSLVLAADLLNNPWWTLKGKVKIRGGIKFDALGVREDYSSDFLDYSHTIAQATQNQCATPAFNPPGGSYPSTQTVSISCATPGATIRYTINGSEPNSSSPVYSSPITVSQNTTLKTKATKSGWTDSSVATAEYTISPIQTVATPTFNPAGGTYTTAQNVTISCTTPGATIFYSTDGSTPSIQYTGAINIASTKTLKAKAKKSGWNDSQIASATYTISPGGTVATPTFNPPGGSYSSTQNVQISCTTSGAIIRYTTNGSNPTESSAQYSSPISVSSTTTIKAKAFKSGWTPSSIASATYTISVPPPPGQMIYVPGGTFTMGRTTGSGYSDELPTHSVTLNSFYIGKYEVTQAEYSQYMQPSSSWTSSYGLGDNYPAYYVSWYAILKYCNLRSMAEGLTPVYTISSSTNPANWGAVPTSNNSTWNAAICNWSANGYRLPTEAEWEYAARGATNNPDYLYSGSNDVGTVAWYDGNNSPYGSKPVGTKASNGIGTFDMSGNVYEWCWDWYSSSYYSSSPSSNPTGPTSGSDRVRRGGSWSSNAYNCRAADRNHGYPNGSYYGIGFRICRAVP